MLTTLKTKKGAPVHRSFTRTQNKIMEPIHRTMAPPAQHEIHYKPAIDGASPQKRSAHPHQMVHGKQIINGNIIVHAAAQMSVPPTITQFLHVVVKRNNSRVAPVPLYSTSISCYYYQ